MYLYPEGSVSPQIGASTCQSIMAAISKGRAWCSQRVPSTQVGVIMVCLCGAVSLIHHHLMQPGGNIFQEMGAVQHISLLITIQMYAFYMVNSDGHPSTCQVHLFVSRTVGSHLWSSTIHAVTCALWWSQSTHVQFRIRGPWLSRCRGGPCWPISVPAVLRD